jgi:chromosomal replication initiator protein
MQPGRDALAAPRSSVLEFGASGQATRLRRAQAEATLQPLVPLPAVDDRNDPALVAAAPCGAALCAAESAGDQGLVVSDLARTSQGSGDAALVPVEAGSAKSQLLAATLQSVVGEAQYTVWFQSRVLVTVEGDDLVVRCDSPFLVTWVQKQFRGELATVARTVLGELARVRFEVKAPRDLTSSAATSREERGDEAQTALNLQGKGAALAGAAQLVTLPVTVVRRMNATEPSSSGGELPQFRPRCPELSDFVVGEHNQLAVAAVRQFLASPESAPVPLFIHSATGLGKTHLLQALAQQLRRQYSGLAVTCLTAENFANLFTQALRDHRLPGFRQRFRSLDILLIDDVDFLDGKRGLQEEFLHTLQQLQAAGKAVVVSGDRHPRLMTKTGEELRSRLGAGLVCRIDAPSKETRRQIVAGKAARWPDAITPEALDYVADRFPANVRELEGAVHCLVSQASLIGRRVGISAARQALGDLERDCVRVVRLVDIDRAVTSLFGLEADALKSPNRTREVSQPRMLAMFLARSLTRSAYSEIGGYFGGRNHSTVISAERRIDATVKGGESWRVASRPWSVGDLVDTLTQQLLAG